MNSRCHWSLSTLGILFAFLLSGCGHFFYYPSPYMYVDLKKVDPAPTEIEFKNKDGKKLIGWYFKAEGGKPKGQILFFHGNAENISSHFMALHWILKEGYDYFIFDYPGYGGSEGESSQETTTDAGQRALEWLNQKNPSLPIIIFGQSLGGNIAMYTAANNQEKFPICMVAVESTFKSYKKVAQRLLNNHWLTWPLQWMPYLVVPEKYSATDRIDKISPTPLLVIHGEADPVVPIANGKDVYEAAKDPKEFWPIKNGHHIQAFFGENAKQVRNDFVNKLNENCAPKASPKK
jgi:fermentation-respiration switch protein FrsA (DUF1100 family)